MQWLLDKEELSGRTQDHFFLGVEHLDSHKISPEREKRGREFEMWMCDSNHDINLGYIHNIITVTVFIVES